MSKLTKAIITGVSYVLVAAMAIGGTVAYLQDSDSDVNVMTLGNVQIEQHEYERVVGADGNYETITTDSGTGYKLQPFTQAKPLYPTTNTAPALSDNRVYFDQLGEGFTGSMKAYDESVTNVLDKYVLVENTGKTDAYVRTLIAYEAGRDTDGLVMTASRNWTYQKTICTIEIDGATYAIDECVYNGGDVHTGGILPAGEVTVAPCLGNIYAKYWVDNEWCEAIDSNNNGTWDVIVLSQAVQTAGFDKAETALDAAFGETNAVNAAAWFGGEDVAIPTLVSSADELVAALENGEDVVLTDDVKIDPAGMSNAYGTTGINVKNGQTIDGNGNTLDIKGAGGTWDSGINTTGGIIKNLTVTGSFRGIFINHNSSHSEPVVLENVTIDGTTYTISCDQGMNQTLTATNSTFNGWTSFAATMGDAEFINCSFGKGNGYAYCRPYAPTTFVGCEFEAGYTVDPRAAVTFENCTLDGVALTDTNIADLVKDTAKVTVK